MTLDQLPIGDTAAITFVGGEGALRRRLLDIGLIPGTRVTCQGHSPAGDPAAYLIRGAVIALREQDARCVALERENVPQAVGRAVLA